MTNLVFLKSALQWASQKSASIGGFPVPALRGDPLGGTAYLVAVFRAQREQVPA